MIIIVGELCVVGYVFCILWVEFCENLFVKLCVGEDFWLGLYGF